RGSLPRGPSNHAGGKFRGLLVPAVCLVAGATQDTDEVVQFAAAEDHGEGLALLFQQVDVAHGVALGEGVFQAGYILFPWNVLALYQGDLHIAGAVMSSAGPAHGE